MPHIYYSSRKLPGPEHGFIFAKVEALCKILGYYGLALFFSFSQKSKLYSYSTSPSSLKETS
ncbi:hypothetical protein BDV33DRAFT_26057 [Aspergillus novoparasiticus]|uniref:Uncharacterized protein n=1 Tax=Aspergillus novoparasiticus TaxID=986946 RepID=A0A5N6ED91_9EURO|nr:hypothetical protein BDV33DRAFT_26057 [Aspergillus novoparasiticus]